jgi:hypothetical protein
LVSCANAKAAIACCGSTIILRRIGVAGAAWHFVEIE